MIDFSKLESLTIPEGVVKQITDASGRVLWSVKIPVTITYSLGSTNFDMYCHVIHKGIEYTESGSFIANIGDTILVRCSPGGTYNSANIYLNKEQIPVANASHTYAEYNYKVVSDATIVKDTGSATTYRGAIFITDITQ